MIGQQRWACHCFGVLGEAVPVRLQVSVVREVQVLFGVNALRLRNRTLLRRREAGWGATGGERSVRNESEPGTAASVVAA